MKDIKRKTLRKAVKIKRNNDIYRLIKIGKKVKHTEITAYIGKNNFNHARYAILVPSKIGRAVYRNKLKRHFREWFRTMKEPPTIPCDILIKIHCRKYKKGRNTIKELLQLWEKIKKEQRI